MLRTAEVCLIRSKAKPPQPSTLLVGLYTRICDVNMRPVRASCCDAWNHDPTRHHPDSFRREVLQVAALASLELTPEELPAMGRDLNAILGYIAQLSELNVANVAPMAQVSEIIPDAGLEAKKHRCARTRPCPVWSVRPSCRPRRRPTAHSSKFRR